MTRDKCIHCLMKAMRCYAQKDIRVWCYLYECCYCLTMLDLSLDRIILLNCDLVTAVKYNRRSRTFLKKYACDLQNAVLGYDYVLTESYWISQLQNALHITIRDDVYLLGYGVFGKHTSLNIIYSTEE